VEEKMKRHLVLFLSALFFLCLPKSAFPQAQDISFSNGLRIKPGAHFEYFLRKITWDDEQNISELKTFIFALNTEIEIDDGFSVSALVGYGLSNYESLTFRQLPLSIELDAGNIGGIILGGDIRKSLFYGNTFELGLHGQFMHQIGLEKNWDVPGLNVPGTVTGKSTWSRVSAGPYFKYTALESFSPYLALYYNNLWGKFKMEQTIQDLKGLEEKKIESKGLIDITLGSILGLSENFFLKGEVHILPSNEGMDFGVVAIAAYLF
jgi:hypothetical protein